VIPSKEQSREKRAMMGRLDDRQQPLFYDFCLEEHVPGDHLLRQIAKLEFWREVQHPLPI
jgi:hypothetical protein